MKLETPRPAIQEELASGDLVAIDALLVKDGRASVLENGTDEGTWELYRDEYLKPELKELVGYRWRTVTEQEDRVGGATVVRQTGVFTKGPETNRKGSHAAITF